MARSTHLEKLVTDALDTRIAAIENNGASGVQANSVTNAGLAKMPANTIKGNATNAEADPQDITIDALKGLLIDDSASGDTDIWSAEKISNEISLSTTSSLKYKGGYDAANNTPALEGTPSDVLQGSTYTVTSNGDFYGEDVQVGDFLISEVDDPTSREDWTIVNSNIGEASTTTKGLVELATNGETAAGVVVQGNDDRLSNSRTPEGTAGGDLTGNYPNPTLATGSVTGDKVANGGIGLAKISGIPGQTLLGNNTGGSASPSALTPTQIRSLINVEDNATGDQNASEVPVTASGNLTSTNVQSALTELQSDIDSLEGTNHAAVTLGTNTNGLSLTDQELQLGLASTSANGAMSSTDKSKLDGIEAGATGDQNALEVPFTPGASGITATNVQDLGLELDGRLDTLEGESHDAVTLGTANGLSLSDQEISLALATGSAAGALSAADKTKLDAIEANAKDDQNASEVPLTSITGVTASNVQAAIAELNTDIESNDTELADHETRLSSVEGNSHVKAVSGNAGIAVNDSTQAISAVVSSTANNKLSLDANGLFVNQTAADISVANQNGISYSNVQVALEDLGKDVHSSRIQRRSVSGPVTLTNTDAKYQHFVVSSDMTGTLPSEPVTGKHFIIKNSPSSNNVITVNSVNINPGEIYEIIYDGSEWVEY